MMCTITTSEALEMLQITEVCNFNLLLSWLQILRQGGKTRGLKELFNIDMFGRDTLYMFQFRHMFV